MNAPGRQWNKPCDLERPFVLKITANIKTLKQELKNKRVDVDYAFKSRIPLGSKWCGTRFDNGLVEQLVLTLVLAILFGPVHMLGWNFHFPTPLEQLLWRFSSIACTGLPIVLPLFICLDEGDWGRMQTFWENLGYVLVLIALVVYALVRLYMLAEVFAGFRAVPAGVYTSLEWSSLIPHWGL